MEPRLGELTVTDVTPDSVGLSWTVPEGEFDSFLVQYKDRDGQPQVVPVATDQREVTIPGLEPSRKYKFLLFGIQDGKRRSTVSVEAKTGERDPHEAEVPAPPSFFPLPEHLSFPPVSLSFTSSFLFEKPCCLFPSQSDGNQEYGLGSWISSPC